MPPTVYQVHGVLKWSIVQSSNNPRCAQKVTDQAESIDSNHNWWLTIVPVDYIPGDTFLTRQHPYVMCQLYLLVNVTFFIFINVVPVEKCIDIVHLDDWIFSQHDNREWSDDNILVSQQGHSVLMMLKT